MRRSRDAAPRILHVSQPTDGGVAHCVADLVVDQTSRGWRCSVACPGVSPLASAVRAAGAQHLSWRADRSPGRGLTAEIASLARIVRDFDPDVVHLHSSKAGFIGRLAIRGRRPTVFQPHAWSFHAVRGRAARGAIAWERYAARHADVILCVSEGERREAREHAIRGDLRVVRNGVDLERYRPIDADERPAIRQRLGLPDDRTIVLTPGRVCEQKGQDLLLDAWPEVRATHPEAQLVLVGDGPLRPSLERHADDSVLFAGNRPDLARWLHAADVVALPSRWEGMSLALLEAMATGASVVSTAVAGADEALDGVGAVVPVGDRRRLAKEIVRRLDDPDLIGRERNAAREIAEARFDVARSRREIVAIYQELMGGRGTRILTGSTSSTAPSTD